MLVRKASVQIATDTEKKINEAERYLLDSYERALEEKPLAVEQERDADDKATELIMTPNEKLAEDQNRSLQASIKAAEDLTLQTKQYVDAKTVEVRKGAADIAEISNRELQASIKAAEDLTLQTKQYVDAKAMEMCKAADITFAEAIRIAKASAIDTPSFKEGVEEKVRDSGIDIVGDDIDDEYDVITKEELEAMEMKKIVTMARAAGIEVEVKAIDSDNFTKAEMTRTLLTDIREEEEEKEEDEGGSEPDADEGKDPDEESGKRTLLTDIEKKKKKKTREGRRQMRMKARTQAKKVTIQV